MERTPPYYVEDLTQEIPGSADVAGSDLSLTQVYDNIKAARIGEDEDLSFGVWERELKKADWELVEKLSVEALKEKSKDLQILGWLIESLVVLDGFKGIAAGIDILSNFLELFWDSCYPRKDDGTSDEEQKIRIIDWIYDSINKRALLVPFVSYNDEKITIYNYDFSVEMMSMTKRSPALAQEIINSAKKNNVKTLDEIQNIIKACDPEYLQSILADVRSVQMAEQSFVEVIKKIPAIDPVGVFYNLIASLDKVEQIIKQYSRQDDGSPEVARLAVIPRAEDVSKRDEIYEQIRFLAKELGSIEKHSPSHYMLGLVVSWKDKSLFEIMTDLKTGETEAHKLLKILLNH